MNDDFREDGRRAFSGHFGNFRAAVDAVLQRVQRNDTVDRVNQPVFSDTGAFVEGALGQVVVAGGGGGEDLNEPARRAVTVVLGD